MQNKPSANSLVTTDANEKIKTGNILQEISGFSVCVQQAV